MLTPCLRSLPSVWCWTRIHAKGFLLCRIGAVLDLTARSGHRSPKTADSAEGPSSMAFVHTGCYVLFTLQAFQMLHWGYKCIAANAYKELKHPVIIIDLYLYKAPSLYPSMFCILQEVIYYLTRQWIKTNQYSSQMSWKPGGHTCSGSKHGHCSF